MDKALLAYEAFTAKVVAAAVEADPHWSRVQSGAGLLRLCAVPRLLHLFRALSPEATAVFAGRADAATLRAYEKVLTAKLTTYRPYRRAWGAVVCYAFRTSALRPGSGPGSLPSPRFRGWVDW